MFNTLWSGVLCNTQGILELNTMKQFFCFFLFVYIHRIICYIILYVTVTEVLAFLLCRDAVYSINERHCK